MSNVDWNYIAGHLASKFYKIGDLKSIQRSANAAFSKELGDFAPASEKDKRYKTIFNFVFTISKIPGLTDDSKVQTIYKLIGDLNETAGVDLEKIQEIFKKGHYFNVDTEKIKGIFQRLEEMKTPTEYLNRKFHKEIVKSSKSYFLRGDYFHAIKTSCVSFNKKIQSLTGLSEDGSKLMGNVFGNSTKILINSGRTTSEKDEQEGFMHISMGLMKAFRNPLAHEIPETWPISKEDCLDILSLLSLLFRRLDKAKLLK